jgi:hypothetical protein
MDANRQPCRGRQGGKKGLERVAAWTIIRAFTAKKGNRINLIRSPRNGV